MARFLSTSTEQTIELGRILAGLLEPDDVVSLSGGLGAGKTQLSKGVAAGLGIDEDVTSPTFPILVEYAGGRLPLFHFDLYRLASEAELDDVDYFGVLESGGASLVEWADKFAAALPDDYLELDIQTRDDGARVVTATGHGARGHALECAFSSAAAAFAAG